MMRQFAFVIGALLAMPVAAEFPAGSACAALGATDVVASYRQLAALDAAGLTGLAGQAFTLAVDDPMPDRWEREALPSGQLRLTYRMGRNHVTEGWNWHPQADPAREDYYRYKYLPLGEREAEVAPPRSESDIPGRSFEAKVVRRDAYYFAFDNPYEFYARNDADDGFAAEVSSHVSSQVADTHARFHLVARGRFAAPWRAASTTYWRAIFSAPVERTLKNYYFMGRLETLWFCSDDGRILAKLGQ